MDLSPIEKKISSIKKNVDFSTRGEELVKTGKVRLGPFPAVSYSDNWNQDPLKNRSWQWRWGSLSLLPYLIAYHAQHLDIAAIHFGNKLIKSWAKCFLDSQPGTNGINEFVWHDHGTALRAEHILWFYTYSSSVAPTAGERDEDIVPLILNLLEKHGSILAIDSFYSQHTNHGLEQARVLLLLGKVGSKQWSKASEWRHIALSRLKSEFDFAYTSEGVHVENSPAYHIFVFKVFISIIQEYDPSELEDLAADFSSKSRLILDYITHVLRPDGHTPIIGDSEKLKPTDSFRKILEKTKEYRNFLYSHSAGKSGVRPSSTYKVYPKSGYAIYRNRWGGPQDFGNVIHAIFKAGPLSKYHRQQDEGNLVVYAYNEDWLIDAGMYNYNNSDPIRKYARSRRGHNVVIIGETEYEPWDLISSAWTLADDTSGGDKKAVNFSFPGFKNTLTFRRLEFDKMTISVSDSIVSTDNIARPVQLLWHVDGNKRIEPNGENGVNVHSKVSNRRMSLEFLCPAPLTIAYKSGIIGSKVEAVTSDLANKYTDAQLIEVNLDPQVSHQITTIITFSRN